MTTQILNEQEEQARLDSYAKSYNADAPFDVKMREYMMRTIEPFILPGDCLQLGCGHGEQTLILSRYFQSVTVIEAVEEFINHTKAQAEKEGIDNIHFEHTMVEHFKSDKKFDNIILSHVLEHIKDDVAVISHLLSYLKDQGRLFVIVPNANAASRLIAVKMGILENTETLSKADIAAGHQRMYHMDKLCGVLRRAGGKIIHTGGIFFKPLANFQFDRLMGGDLISDDFMEGCFELGKDYPAFTASILAIIEKK